MTTLAAKKRREKTNSGRKVPTQTFNSPGGIYKPTFGKKIIFVSGHAEPGYIPQQPSVAYYNPNTPGNVSGSNPVVPGTVQYNPSTPGNPTGNVNAPTPGTATGVYNPPTPGNYVAGTSNPGTVLWTMVQGQDRSYSDGHSYSSPHVTNNGSNPSLPSPATWNQYTYYTTDYNVSPPVSVYSYMSTWSSYSANSYTPGNSNAPRTNPATPGTVNYNPVTPGNPVYNPATPGNAIYNPTTGGTLANYNPTNGGNASYNPSKPGTLSGYNPTVPGNQSYNPPKPAQTVYTVTNGPGAPSPETYVSGYFSISPYANYNPTNQWYSVVNVDRSPGQYVPGNSFYNPSSGGNAKYNPSTPGNVYYNPVVPGTANYNPLVPGNANYNPTIPGSSNYNPTIPGNANYNSYVEGRAGAPATVLGVLFPGGAFGLTAPTVGRTMTYAPETPTGIVIELPPNSSIIIEEL